MSKKYILLSLCFLMALSAFGQTQKAFQQAADEAFAKKNYYAALTYYNEVLAYDKNDVEALKNSAEAARLFNSYQLAAEKYSYLIDTLGYTMDSTAFFNLADMYQHLGDYDKATQYFDLYLSQYSKDGEYLSEKAKLQKEASLWAASRIKEVDENATFNRLESDANSNFSDFGAHEEGDVLYFSSMRFTEKNPLQKPPKSLSKVMTIEGESSAKPVEGDINERDVAIANSVFNSDKSKLFYTVCEYKDDNDLRCDIYWAKVNPDGTFKEEQRLPSPVNDVAYTNTHPAFGKDPVTGNEILYFVSDRPGGKGKLDIWYSVFDKKLGFSNPINLSDINTAEDDLTPFYHIPTNTLYFSSNGKLGFGGYDIFQASYKDGKYTDIEILPAPYNSSYHDVYYKLSDDGKTAYESSNRAGANYIDNVLQSCCYDIYKAEIDPVIIDLNALTFDKTTGLDLTGATVRLIDKTTGKLIGQITSDDTNEHIFELTKGVEYLIIADKENYKSDTITYSTIGAKKSESVVKKLYLDTDVVTLDAFTFDAQTKEALNGATIMIEDLTDPSNPKMVKVNEAGNDFHFLLEKNKTYKISAIKNGYTTVTETIDTRGVTGKITKNFYLNKFNLERLLPLALYFDNDEPDPDSKSTATTKIYGDLVHDYMMRKPTFIVNYSKNTKGEEKQASIERMETFFEGDVRGGYDRFSIFMDELIKVLDAGQKIELTIRGYASPRFDVKYNLVLGQRRINSVRNDMMRYRNGALASYLINKKLIVTEISYGEELSPIDVIDNINDERSSIYSLKASKERKVEVISVKSK